MRGLNLNKRINPGSLNRKINILTTTESTNEAGDTILIPSVLKTVLAAIAPVGGRDYFEAKKYQAELTYIVTIRYFSGLTPDMQIQFGERFFLIQDIINIEEKNMYLDIICIERIAKNG